MSRFAAVCADPVTQVNIAARCQHTGNAGVGINWNEDDDDPLNVSDPLIGNPTINNAIIQAAIQAVRQAKQEQLKEVTINSRNDKLINSMGVWKNRWIKNDWKKPNGRPVKNMDEIKDLMDACNGIRVNWVYVNNDEDEGIVRAKLLAEKGLKKCTPKAKKQELVSVDQLSQNLGSMKLNAGNGNAQQQQIQKK